MVRRTKVQIDEYNKNILEQINKINTVEGMFWWKKLSDNKFSDNKFSVEKINEDKTKKLEWENTDVLYSFLGIYVIGLLAYYPNEFHKTRYKIHNNKNDDMYSLERVSKRYKEFTELNSNQQLKEFIKVYFSIGNIIPTWPGANVNRGKSYMFDIPEIYYSKNELWTKILIEIYKNSYLEQVLDGRIMFKDDNWYINNPPFFSFNSTPDFLNSIVNENYSLNVTKNLYTKWLERIVGIIKDRNEKINKWLEKNNNLVLR